MAENSKFPKKRAKALSQQEQTGNEEIEISDKIFRQNEVGYLFIFEFWDERSKRQKIKINISFLVKITMAEEKILENHNVNTIEHEMKTQGCHLKEIKKKFLNELIIFRNSLISKHLTNFLQFSFRFSDKMIKKGGLSKNY